jgi:tetratricopeptide (TPR) repeat protein
MLPEFLIIITIKNMNEISKHLSRIFLDRNDASAYLALGICYKERQEYDKAIKYLERCVTLSPDNYNAFFQLGLCNQQDGFACKAIKCFIRAIEIDPAPEAILQLGYSHELCEEYDLARMIYQKLIDTHGAFVKSYDDKSIMLKNYYQRSRLKISRA